MKWFYTQPVDIHFETGGLAAIGSLIAAQGYRKGLLVCDPFLTKNGLADKIVQLSHGAIKAVYSDITPNPRVEEVDACAAIIRAETLDFVVATGGGSSMDCAKAACAVARTQDSITAYHSGGKKLPADAVPLIAIPTTAGTGSEVTCVAVLSDEARGLKAPIASNVLYPKLVLIDAELTLSVPPKVTASTGLDVLSHALEGFWSRAHQPICDALALHAAKLAFTYLPQAFDCGDDLHAREKMCEASVIAGLAFTLPKTAASHACSFPLTSVYHLPHGEACAFTLGRLCEINAAAEDGRLEGFAHALGFESAAAMGWHIDELKRYTGMACTLADAKIPLGEVRALAERCTHPNILNNPVPLAPDDVEKLLLSLQ